MNRRDFIATTSFTGLVLTTPSLAKTNTPTSHHMTALNQLQLPALPWENNALNPIISTNTIGFHYGKHHKSYYDNLAKLLPNTPLATLSLSDIVKQSADNKAIFNNAAQAWNHTFFWYSLAPNSGGKPPQALNEQLERDFGGFDKFKIEFTQACSSQFGSGWVWLALDKAKNKLTIVKTSNADTPLTNPTLTPLAVVDVWEHAYYLDYQNRRADYANAILDKLFNWRFVESNLA